jgi:hypothetical protein
MKSGLYLFLLVIISTFANAQSFEVGINGGMSTTTKPKKSAYTGEGNMWESAVDLNFHYNFNERWQTGLSVGMTSWSVNTEWPASETNGSNLKPQDVKLVFAKRAVSFAFQFNHVVPFHKQYEDFLASQLYFGVSAGAVVTGNDGKQVFVKQNPNTGIEYTATSEYHFQPGYGWLTGIQVGYTYYFGPHFGANIHVWGE